MMQILNMLPFFNKKKISKKSIPKIPLLGAWRKEEDFKQFIYFLTNQTVLSLNMCTAERNEIYTIR